MPSLAELPEIVGFFSYSRDDDRDSDGSLSLLRRRIQNELRGQLGRSENTLRLWQDAEAIPPGTLWESQISGAIEHCVFFIPIISPRVINSKYCQIEFQKFLDRENQLGRVDLVFPILYIDIPLLKDETRWREHPVLKLIGVRQYVDWCDFRFELNHPNVHRAVAAFGRTIVTALEHQVPDGRAEAEERAAHEREAAREEERVALERAAEQRRREEAEAAVHVTQQKRPERLTNEEPESGKARVHISRLAPLERMIGPLLIF